jgi:transcriptional regulator with XRE-family HTH domain
MAAVNGKGGNNMEPKERSDLAARVGKNIKALMDAVGVKQSKVAQSASVAVATVSNYLNDRMPPLDFLVDICRMKEFKDKGINLTVDLLLSENFNPQAVIENNTRKVKANPAEDTAYGKFLGNYLCYFSDKGRSGEEEHCLRYGVMSFYDTYESLTGDVTIKASALFFSNEEKIEAFSLKASLDAIGKTNNDFSVKDRNKAIAEKFACRPEEIYEGEVFFTDNHVFVNIVGKGYGDNALIILYSPEEDSVHEYAGGLGSVNSVTRGRSHSPAMQKMILSKYKLGCSDETIYEHTNMRAGNIMISEQTEVICDFARKIYSDKEIAGFFDEKDKKSMMKRRMEQLVKEYIDDNVNSVEIVSTEEDQDVYELICRYKDQS